ncbi:MAG: M23 family metallopeptidase [Acidobacteria bacterium]|nr:MAG: M23 family metallopeptidase [Acidobacteriota bacterium]
MTVRSGSGLLFAAAVLLGPAAALPAAAGPSSFRLLCGRPPDGHSGGSDGPAAPLEPLDPAERTRFEERVRRNVARLRAEGRLEAASAGQPVLFSWPLALARGLSDPGYHGVSGFVDHDPSFPDALLDYECGDRTYDTAGGYNHRGTDYFPSPHGWYKMEHEHVLVVAAADGQIVVREDGHEDHNCQGGGTWNAIVLRHADGSESWYGHLKKGSLTPKQVGGTVAEGEYLGVIGSSGNSSGPHLHFEVHDSTGKVVDPYSGPCNNAPSRWQDQRPYDDSALNKITTGDAAPEKPPCPGVENPHARATFPIPATIYFTAYYRDQLAGQVSHYTIRRPDGSVFAEWDHSSPAPHLASSHWTWFWHIGTDEPAGRWRFEVTYLGRTLAREFVRGSPVASGRVPQFPVQGALLEVSRAAGGRLRLTWGPSCVASDDDFAVYEGRLGDFQSHRPVLCSTGGQRSASITPALGSTYYLVAPRNAEREGSLGVTGDETPRAEGAGRCLPRDVIACPY